MLSFKLIELIETHSDQIIGRVVRQIRRNGNTVEMSKLPEADLRERARDILMHIGTWLVSREDELASRYERLGRQRCEEGVPLHEIVQGLHIIKEQMIEYVRDQGYGQTPLELYAEEELYRGANRIFDTMVFYVIRGYEQAMKGQARAAV